MEALLRFVGLHLSETEKEMKALVQNSYSTVRVVGRGTVKIDAQEIRKSQEFKAACIKARELVKS